MRVKILFAAAAVLLVAAAGVAFAVPGWQGAFQARGMGMMLRGNWAGMMNNSSWTQNGMGRPMRGNWTGMNWTGRAGMPMRGFYNSTMNRTEFVQERGQFQAAVLSGDFATAKSLHDSYGFGGGLFDSLNETTFAQYSRIYGLRAQAQNLSNALGLELGLKGQPVASPHALARGMHHRLNHNTKAPSTP